MPFVIEEHRVEIRRLGPVACKDVGDICFFFYDKMVEKWKQNPRWTTAHWIYRDFVLDDGCTSNPSTFWGAFEVLQAKFDLVDVKAAIDLAWQCFFMRYVWNYELEKIQQNGDI